MQSGSRYCISSNAKNKSADYQGKRITSLDIVMIYSKRQVRREGCKSIVWGVLYGTALDEFVPDVAILLKIKGEIKTLYT